MRVVYVQRYVPLSVTEREKEGAEQRGTTRWWLKGTRGERRDQVVAGRVNDAGAGG